MYRIIYYWRGERHVHSACPQTRKEANELVDLLRKDGWVAHWENDLDEQE